MAQELSEEHIEYAYAVIDALSVAMQHVAINPEKIEQLEIEFIKKMPDLFDALMILLPTEHGGIIYKLFQSTARYARTWMKLKIKSKKDSG